VSDFNVVFFPPPFSPSTCEAKCCESNARNTLQSIRVPFSASYTSSSFLLFIASPQAKFFFPREFSVIRRESLVISSSMYKCFPLSPPSFPRARSGCRTKSAPGFFSSCLAVSLFRFPFFVRFRGTRRQEKVTGPGTRLMARQEDHSGLYQVFLFFFPPPFPSPGEDAKATL